MTARSRCYGATAGLFVGNALRGVPVLWAVAAIANGLTHRNGTEAVPYASLWISGSGNSVDKTTGAFGFNNLYVGGSDNKAQRLLSVGAINAGIDLGVPASDNILKKSFSARSQNAGIRASAGSSLNLLTGNVASDSVAPFDLFEGNPDCGTNTWEENGGVGNDACID